MTNYTAKKLNHKFKNATPSEIIKWVLSVAQRPIITTNFGPYSASLLHAVTSLKADIPVLWGDSGYNLAETYTYANTLQAQLGLNLKIYVPQYTRAYIDARFEEYMADEQGRTLFSQLVKIEPLQRAFNEHTPDIWFTNIRKEQTSFRKSLDIFSLSQSGILKVSPFYNYSKKELAAYLDTHQLPNQLRYFDPTKMFGQSECGLHLSKI